MAKFGKKLRKAVKKVGRVHAKVFAKTVKVITPILSAAATIYAGPAAGLAVTAGMAGASRYAGATAARAEGKKGKAARDKGRSLMRQVIKYGALGTGVGAIGGAIAGGSALFGLAGAAKAAAPAVTAGIGTTAASVAPSIGSTLLSAAPSVLGTGAQLLQGRAASPVPGGDKVDGFVTQSDLENSLANPGAQAADDGILGTAAKLFQTGLGVYGQLRSQKPGQVPADASTNVNVDSNGDGVPDMQQQGGGFMASVSALPMPVKLAAGAAVAFVAWKMLKKKAG